jgi:hypothetical protein
MSRAWAGVLAVLVLVLSACAGPAQPPLARITGACPLLVSVEAGLLLGTDLVPVENNFGGVNETLYSCSYTRDKHVIVDFSVSEFYSRGIDPAGLISSVTRRAKTTPVPGVGEAAVSYERVTSGVFVLMAAKKAGPNLRLISFEAASPYSSNRLAALASIAMSRL